MKQLFITLCLSVMAISATAAGKEHTDTIKTLTNVSSVTVTENGGKTVISVTGTYDNMPYRYSIDSETVSDSDSEISLADNPFDFDLPFTSEKKRRRCHMLWLRDIYTGMLLENNYTGMGGGWEIGVGQIVGIGYQPWRNGPKFRTAIGFGVRNMGTDKGYRFNRIGGKLLLEPEVDGAEHSSSHLTSHDIRIPFSIQQKIYKSFFIECSAILNFNIYTDASTEYTIDGIKYRETYKGLHQRLLTPEFRATIGFSNAIAVYYSSPFTTMRRDYGPQFRHSCVGISLFF